MTALRSSTQITRILQTHPATYPHLADTTQFVADTQAQTPEPHPTQPNATQRNHTKPNAQTHTLEAQI